MKTFAFDLESFYSATHSIQRYGSINYLAHAESDIYLMAVVGSGGFRWTGRPEQFNWELFRDARFVAHNASFDCSLFPALNLPRPADYNCTANLSAYFGSARSLSAAALKHLGVAVSKAPRDSMKGRQWGEISQEEQAALSAYCLADAELCLALWKKLSPQWPAHEAKLSRSTIDLGHRGVQVDLAKLRAFSARAREIRAEALPLIPWATDPDDTVLSTPAATRHCELLGIRAPSSFAEKSEECAQWEKEFGGSNLFVAAMRDYRKANTLLKKLEAMERRIMPNGRMNFDLKYFGAHTGRWSGGGGVNLQNLARKPWNGIYLRELLIPSPGKKFIVADLSNIEPRVLALLAGDEDLLGAMRLGFNVYEAMALTWRLWSGAHGTLKKTDENLYNYIKSLCLGAGYGMGWRRFQSICAQRGLELSDEEAKQRIDQYRARNPLVLRLWERLDREFACQVPKGMAYSRCRAAGRWFIRNWFAEENRRS